MDTDPDAKLFAPSDMVAFTADEMSALDEAMLTERILDRQARVYEIVGELIATRAAGAADFLSRFEYRHDRTGSLAAIIECKDCGDSSGVLGTDVAALYRAAVAHVGECPARVEQTIADWILFDERQLAAAESHGDSSAPADSTPASRLWVNTSRPAPPHWRWAKSATEAIRVLQVNEVLEMSLDHDVAGDATARAVILWLTEHPDRWPTEILLHGSEAKRADWLLDAIKRHRPTTW